jgi:orotidine-5'-phosphate decarboxylase
MTELIVALDVEEKKATELVNLLSEEVEIFKIGFPLFSTCSPEFIKKLQEKKKKIFFDFKFHDIPATVSRAVLALMKYKPFAFTLHISGGEKMLKEAVDTVRHQPVVMRPLLFGVTVLTSLEEEDIEVLGFKRKLSNQVVRFALLAKNVGLNGIVASGREIDLIRKACGEDFLLVVPGIRLAGEEIYDQRRTITPALASAKGANYIVVGRPITESEEPLTIVKKIKQEI